VLRFIPAVLKLSRIGRKPFNKLDKVMRPI
jgi:hypothetical protein